MKKDYIFSLGLLLLSLLVSCGATRELVILHVNDTHSYFAEEDGEYGVTRMYTVIKEARAENSNVIVLHGGDMMTGSVYCNIFKGEMNVDLLNMMGFNYLTIGNHEFDQGLERFFELQDMAEFQVLSANILNISNEQPIFQQYAITNVAGINIVIIGLTTSQMDVLNPDVKDLITIREEDDTLDYLLNDLMLDDTNDFVICLTHIGVGEDKSLAKKFPEVDLFVGGHSHSKKVRPSEIEESWIVQAGGNGEYIGKLTYWFDKKNQVKEREYTLIELDEDITNSPYIDVYMAEKDEAMSDEVSEVLCESEFEISRSDWGYLITDAMLDSMDVDVVIINTGGVRTDISAGEVTVADIYEVYPFDNNIYIVTMTGELLKEIIDKGINGSLYWSSSLMVYDTNNESILMINGEAVDPKKSYQVGTIDFIYEGGDGFDEFAESDEVIKTTSTPRDVMIEWFDGIDILTEDMVGEDRLIR